MGTPNQLCKPVWWDLRGCRGGEAGFLWVRGVEAGEAGTGPEANPFGLDVTIRLERYIKGSWLGAKKEKG